MYYIGLTAFQAIKISKSVLVRVEDNLDYNSGLSNYIKYHFFRLREAGLFFKNLFFIKIFFNEHIAA